MIDYIEAFRLLLTLLVVMLFLMLTGCGETGKDIINGGRWPTNTIYYNIKQQRKDRDKYIKVNYTKIPTHIRYDFDISHKHLYSISEYPYDIKSIMHYSSNIYGNKCLTRLDGGVIKQVYKPSQLDYLKLNSIYGVN